MSMEKDIQGYEGIYSVTDDGEVFSYRSQKFLKPDNVRGYMQVTLYKDGKSRRYKVHRLVAEAFVPNPRAFPLVNHKDEDKGNNAAGNLEWCTVEYNNKFGTRTSRSAETQIKNAPKQKRTRCVVCIETGDLYISTKEAERATGVYHSHISRCCRGVEKKAGGFRWEYA